METKVLNEGQRRILALCEDLTEEEKTLVILKMLEIKSERKNKIA